MISFPPGLILIIGSLLLPFLPKRFRSSAFLFFPLAAFFWLIILRQPPDLSVQFLVYNLVLTHVDGLSLCFGYVFTIITFLGGIYGFHLKDTSEQVCTLLYAGSSLCVIFAGDLFTLFFFWEMMAISSVYLIWARGTSPAKKAGFRYLMVHLFGGVILLAGILLYFHQTGSTTFNHFETSAATYLILFSFCLNAAVPPLHAWLSDAYPEGTVTGSVYLSVFTTKTAVYALARGFAGLELLAWVGAIMAIYGVIYAVIQNDIRRILAYHIISQVGYMVCGIGIGTAIALDGATAHAFTNILYKSLLFMGAGAILYSTDYSKLTELGGLFKKTPIVFILFMLGTFSISGLPLFAGFASKPLIINAAELSHLDIIFVLLNLASVGTFLSIAFKLAYFTWFGAQRNIKVRRIPTGMYIGMGLLVFACIAIGIYPPILYNILPYPVDYEPYTYLHIINTCLLFLFTGLCFWLLKDKLSGKPGIILDTDWFYRKPAGITYNIFVVGVSRLFGYMERSSGELIYIAKAFAADPLRLLANKMSAATSEKFRIKSSIGADIYSADRYRVSVTVMLSIVIIVFIVILVLGIINSV